MPHNEKVQKKIQKCAAAIERAQRERATLQSVPGTSFMLNPATDNYELDQLPIASATFKKLYPHQRKGIEWLWSLHRRRSGGILGDDMGLGKTIQMGVFLSALYAARVIDRALIVMPASLLDNWTRELTTWYRSTNTVKAKQSKMQS